MSFITVDLKDPAAGSYMRGSFARDTRALPMPSFQVDTQSDRLTLHLVPLAEIERPRFSRILWTALRPEAMPLTFGPLVLSLFYWFLQGQPIDFLATALSALALFFVHAGVFMLNDFSDHLKGLDGIHPGRGSQVIQRGWLAAFQVQRLAIVSLIVASILGILVTVETASWILPLGGFALAAILAFTHVRLGLKYKGVGDALIFLCFGPLLMMGCSLAVAGQVDARLSLVGLFLGCSAVFVFHVRQFETLMADTRRNSGTFISRLGFDRAKIFLKLEIIFLGFTGLAFCLLQSWVVSWLWVAAFWWMYQIWLRLNQARSPVSSSLVGLNREAGEMGRVLLIIMILVLFGEKLWI